jgi:hypothetical protein
MNVPFDPVVIAATVAVAAAPIAAVSSQSQDVLMHGSTTSALGVVALVLYKLTAAIVKHMTAMDLQRQREAEEWQAQGAHREAERDYWRTRRNAL